MRIGVEKQNVSQVVITTATNITTNTKDTSGRSQKNRNVIVDNGVNAITITVDASAGFLATYLKHGTGIITFIAGTGRTLIFEAVSVGSALMDGAVGSTATITSVGTADYLKLQND